MSNDISSYISKFNIISVYCHWVWKYVLKSIEYIYYLGKAHQKCVPNYVSGIRISWEHVISTWIYIKICCLSMIEIVGFRYKSYSIPYNWHYSSYNTHTRTMKYLGLLILVSGSFALPRVSCNSRMFCQIVTEYIFQGTWWLPSMQRCHGWPLSSLDKSWSHLVRTRLLNRKLVSSNAWTCRMFSWRSLLVGKNCQNHFQRWRSLLCL